MDKRFHYKKLSQLLKSCGLHSCPTRHFIPWKGILLEIIRLFILFIIEPLPFAVISILMESLIKMFFSLSTKGNGKVQEQEVKLGMCLISIQQSYKTPKRLKQRPIWSWVKIGCAGGYIITCLLSLPWFSPSPTSCHVKNSLLKYVSVVVSQECNAVCVSSTLTRFLKRAMLLLYALSSCDCLFLFDPCPVTPANDATSENARCMHLAISRIIGWGETKWGWCSLGEFHAVFNMFTNSLENNELKSRANSKNVLKIVVIRWSSFSNHRKLNYLEGIWSNQTKLNK